MPLTFVQQASGTTGAATSFTSVTPAFTGASVTGDMVLLVMASDATVSTPSGWAADDSVVQDQGLYCYRRTSAGETSFAAVTITGSTCWWLIEYSGQAATPLDVHVSSSTAANPSSFATASSGTLAQADELALAVFSLSGGSPPTWSAETGGFTELAADIVTTKVSGTNIDLVVTSLAVASTSAVSSTGTITGSGAPATLLVTYKASAAAAAEIPDVAMALMTGA